ncbi:CDP-diacylglycerol diphosphatase [Acidomonas methanolica]|uniref:CDP-diacylglycerol pyrophosphatase n=1 Tax=Acidomonas methanolica NBRC 104435 TaxID=1231351 RepID=A0A023D4H2_ACIMT|nr:CDP-diacylglycerol diphosphatase [Acidomonas methanolica]TCS32237.1 CDP-diacylglycerol pyrophosphatase [Acidomonas methanolica]GAJ29042.1 CDP-diacylglycerol pyrophosphatase [Acidomonas methanolica NBRC 104435]GBQ49936.1 CDP-diacylglycerol pyrophosphatase [Acidomonas methanolica]GEK97672.1 CDP-diacylglycerol pyrophosphatase [Acidomonas methanolica NBRC 104435]
MSRRRRWPLFGMGVALCAAVVVLSLGLGWRTRGHDPDALWKIVHGRCASGGRPCAVYDAKDGYALLHSIEGKGQYLLIPTAKVTGIESPAVLTPDAPNYFAEAWAARGLVSKAYGAAVPDRGLSLAINSEEGRSQNQLHIHIDCLRPGVREALDAMAPSVGTHWSSLPQPLLGHAYRAILLPDLHDSPFLVLADGASETPAEMGLHTLVVVTVPGGFLLLDDKAQGLDRASGEEVQDHTCRGFLPRAVQRENSR